MGCLHTRGYIARSPAGRGLPCLPREIDPLITIIALCHDAIVAVEISRFRVRVNFRVSVRVGSEFTGIQVSSVLFSSIKSTIWVYIHYGELIPLSGLETLNIRLGKPYEHMTHHLGSCTRKFGLF